MDHAQGVLRGARPERTLRVAHLVSSFLHITERWIHAQVRGASGSEALVLNCGRRANETEFPVTRLVSLGDLDPGACAREAGGWERRGVSPTLLRQARRFGCDLVHAHFGPMGTVGVSLAEALGVPLVTSFYGYDVGVLPRDAAWRRAYRRLFACGARFLAEGPVLARSLALLGCPRDRIGLMPLPVTTTEAPAGAPDSEPVVLLCSRLIEKKGVDDSLRAIARARRYTTRGFRTIVAGEGPDLDRLLALRHDLGLDDTVAFVGAVAPSALADLLAQATVLVQMSRVAANGDCEGGAPVILSDAAAAAVPVVATRHCDIPDIVLDGKTGLLVESGDVGGAARALIRLLDDPALRRRLGETARQRALEEFSPAACGARLRLHYEQALASAPRPSARARGPQDAGPAVESYLISFRRRAGDTRGLRRVFRARGYPSGEAAVAVSLITLETRVAASPDLSAGGPLRDSMEDLIAACERVAWGRGRSRRFATLRHDVWTLAYRFASEAERGTAADRQWAFALFDRLSGAPGLTPDLRGGAWFHLARLHLSYGRTVEALASAARCLAFIPAHEAAARLLDAQHKAA